jgi:lysophospholipase L1-like esterase
MNVNGERILIFGDSLTHHGDDSAAEIWDVDAESSRASSAPGDLLASLLLEQGAAAVRTDANVGRSAHNFWAGNARHQFHSAQDLIADDQTFAPTKVIVMLGTNDADSGAIDQAAMEQIRDAYANMGAEVWAVGPPVFADDTLSAKADQVYSMMSNVFGARLIDARPLSSTDNRAGDGVHFQPVGAQQLALQLATALITTSAPKFPWLALAFGAGIFGLLGFLLWRSHKSDLTGITVKTAGVQTLKINLTNITDDEIWKLDDALDEVGRVVGQDGDDIFVRTDDRSSPVALYKFMAYAKRKGIDVTEIDGEGLNGSSMLKTIAAESRSPKEYARRAEAWASSEARPPSIASIVKAYRGAAPGKLAKLIREARKQREMTSRRRFEALIAQPEGDDLDGQARD